MRFTLTIDCDNTAFGEKPHERAAETVRILRAVADRLEAGAPFGRAIDANGNTVGFYGPHVRRVNGRIRLEG